MADSGENHAGSEPQPSNSNETSASAQDVQTEFLDSPQKDDGAPRREDLGYDLFQGREKTYRETMTSPYGKFENLFDTYHPRCKTKLTVAMKSNPFVKLLLKAMEESGCSMYKDRHFSCEPCGYKVAGGFDPQANQVVLCQNIISSQGMMNRVLTHELIHAFDHCRGKVDWYNNLQHVACSEIRAANLSGDCSFSGEFRRFQLKGVKKHHQTCVWQRARDSVKVVRNCTDEEAARAVDSVWDTCFNDLAPFHKIPRNKKDALRAARFRYDYDI
ncbi:ATP23 [Branchiostoma lanceolatum]|uniref:Mitochondrial inner membrane protease ATP23 n=1 Tax=Branchiostoma lanceolatum TaxID=7740 RepID=A0A8K0ET38_BRALA|nr:ATP23 [Branchiostoma lanceolatum]